MKNEFEEFYEKMLYFVTAIVKQTVPECEVDDCVSISIVKLWNKKHEFQNKASFNTWAFRVVKNESLMWIRKQVRHWKDSLDDDDNWGWENAFKGNLEDEILIRDEILHIDNDLSLCRTRNSDQVDSMILAAQEYTANEVVTETDTTLGMHKARLHRIRKKLKKRRDRREAEFSRVGNG